MQDPGQSGDLSGSSIGRFRIVKRLGAGGMGEVYLAEDSQLRRTVAIKRMSLRLGTDPRHRQRFLREAQTASRLNDPHIAAIHDVFEREGEIFLVMERVEGETLRHLVREPMKLGDFLPLAIQCAEGLAAAHAQGVVHRDIKPENIMVTPAGVVKILDFGLAHFEAAEGEAAGFETEPGTLGGTAGYMAPETLLEGEADARSDIFSMGVVFYEALTGRHPFRARTGVATSNRVLNEEPPAPSSIMPALPTEIDRIIGRMLAKNPAARYAKATEVAADLEWLQQSGTTPTLEAQPAPSLRRHKRRRRWLALGAAALVVALAAIPALRRAVRTGIGLPAGSERQLAVLPFAVRGGTAEQRAFAAGLTDMVTARLTELSATHSLSVVPASMVFAKKVNSPDMARSEFGVNLVVTGSMQEAEGRIRVTYALVNARTKRQIAASTKTAAATDPFAVEDDVSNGVLNMLQVQLLPGERKTLSAKGTDKPGAYAFYLQGRGYLENYEKPENISNAIEVFHRALKIDPGYARAYAGLGQAYWRRYVQTGDTEWPKRSEKACNQAISITPHLVAARICLGMIATGTGNYAQAVDQFKRALAVQPTNDDAYKRLAEAYGKMGRVSEAEQTFQKAIALRPQYWAGYSWLGNFYYQHGRYKDAENMFQQVVALVPDSFSGYSNLGAVYAQSGDFAKAVRMFKRSLAIRPNASAYSNLGFAEFYMHRYDEAVANFEKAAQLAPNEALYWRNIGDSYYRARGKRKQAEAAYHKAIEKAEAVLQVNPKDVQAYKILAVCRAMTGAKKEALAAIGRTLALAPDDPDAMYAAAVVYTQLGERENGMKWLKKAVAEGIPAAIAWNDPALNSLHDMNDFPSHSGGPKTNARRKP